MPPSPTTPDPARPVPVDRVRSTRPEDVSWRADAFAGSRHSRWVDELRRPLENHDLDRAQEICGQVTRRVLQDFAPALLLLSGTDRSRLQALTAYTLTLFDFVRQTGLEGERLAAINRWEFDLEAALEGRGVGQPVFVTLADLEEQQPWDREAFDDLHALARRRTAVSRPADLPAAEKDAGTLAEVLIRLFLGEEPAETLCQFGSVLIRLRGLIELGDDLRRHRARLPMSELPETWRTDGQADLPTLTVAIGIEGDRLRSISGEQDPVHLVPKRLRPATRYAELAVQKLLEKVDSQGAEIVYKPPRLGLLDRLILLLRSRWA